VHRFHPARLAALVLAAPIAAWAQTDAKPREEPKKLDTIEVKGDAEKERRESTAAKTVVTHDEIVKYGDTTVLDAMKRLPGVTVVGNSIRLRGLGAGYTQILVNGEPVPPGFSLESISPDLIERIEIYRGATAQFSAQAIAGTINIVLRQAVSQRQRELKAGASIQNGEVSAYASAQLSDRAGNLAYTLPVAVNQFRFRGTSRAEQLGTDAVGNPVLDYVTAQAFRNRGENIGFSPRLRWDFAKDHSLSSETFVNFNRFHGEFSERSTTLFGTPPQFAASDLDINVRSTAARSNLVWTRRSDDGARIEVKAGVTYNRRVSHVDWEALDAADVFILHRTVDGHATDTGATSSGKYVLPLIAEHAMALGWDGAYSRRQEDRLQRVITFAGLTPFNIDESYDARVLRLAAFAQDEWEATPRFSMYAGLRWEGLDTRDVGNVVQSVYNRSSVWSPIVNVLWKIPGTDKDQVRAGLARTYKAPTTFQIIPRRYIANNNTATTPDFQGNPDLKPELAWGLDAAYEHYFTGGGLFSVSAYARRIDDVIRNELIVVNDTFITRPANVGRATVHGVELDTKFNLHQFLEWAPAADVRANLARNWSSVDSLPGPNNRLTDQVPFSATLGFDYRFREQPLTIGGSFAFTSGGPVRLSITQTQYTAPRRNLDAYALWKFTPAVQLRVTASNLLAQDDSRVSGYLDPAGPMLALTTVNPTFRRYGATLEVKL
jgi:outer membrane receptor for ferrienterochelin and colicins